MISTLRLLLLASALCLPAVATAKGKAAASADAAELTLTPEEEEALMLHLEEHANDRYRKALELRDQDPEAYQAMLAKVARHMESSDPERFAQKQRLKEAKGELHGLVEAYPTLDGGAQREQREVIAVLCDEIFELRQAQRRYQLEAMSEKLQNLTSEIDERDRRKQEILDEFVAELLGERPKIEGL